MALVLKTSTSKKSREFKSHSARPIPMSTPPPVQAGLFLTKTLSPLLLKKGGKPVPSRTHTGYGR